MRSRKTYVTLLLLLFFLSGVLRNIRNPLIIQADETEQVSPDEDDTQAQNQDTSSSSETPETPSDEPNSNEADPDQNEETSSESESASSEDESTSAESEEESSESETDPEGEEPATPEQTTWVAELSSPEALAFLAKADPEAFEEEVSFNVALLSDADRSTFEALIQAVLPDYESADDAGDDSDAMPQMQMMSEPDPSEPEVKYEVYLYDLSFRDGEEQPVQPASDEFVTISIQGDELKGKELFQVYHQNSSESIEEVSPAQYDPENGTVTFVASSFSPYAVVLQTPSNQEAIYLNGKLGDDGNDGSTREKAVKTFTKAKELATKNQSIKTIYVTGTVPIEGDISRKGTQAEIVRDPNFNDYLFVIPSGATVSLSDIVIDGNSENNPNIEKSLVDVRSGATLNISEDAILRNNKIKAITNTATKGGAVHAYSATINMSGGSVEGNQATYGGGIHLNKSKMNFSGGTVQNNKSNLDNMK